MECLGPEELGAVITKMRSHLDARCLVAVPAGGERAVCRAVMGLLRLGFAQTHARGRHPGEARVCRR